MRAIYEATHAVPALGIESGDLVVIDQDDGTAPLRVIRPMGRPELALLLTHLDRFPLLRLSPSPAGSHRAQPEPLRPRQGARRWLRLLK